MPVGSDSPGAQKRGELFDREIVRLQSGAALDGKVHEMLGGCAVTADRADRGAQEGRKRSRSTPISIGENASRVGEAAESCALT